MFIVSPPPFMVSSFLWRGITREPKISTDGVSFKCNSGHICPTQATTLAFVDNVQEYDISATFPGIRF